MKRQKAECRILQETEARVPDGMYTISCPFTEDYFKAYRSNEKKIMRNVEAYAAAYCSTADIQLH